MRNFQDTFETCNWSFISAFSICMTVPLILTQTRKNLNFVLEKYESGQVLFYNKTLLSRSILKEVFCKKGVFRNSQNSQENTCVRIFLKIKLQTEACNFIKKKTLTQVFFCEFCKISKNTFSYRTPLVAASDFQKAAEAYSQPCPASNTERFAKTANGLQSLTTFTKPSP